jgi:glycosyltransferase involved in cell wall biosynthesis
MIIKAFMKLKHLLLQFYIDLNFPKFTISPNLDLVVLSAQNLRMAGGLSILLQFISELRESNSRFQIVCFVHSNESIDTRLFHNIPFIIISLPFSSKSWLFRIYYEYFAFYIFSLSVDVKLWIALHDITPFVKAQYRLLFYHNAILFWRPPISELFSSLPVLIAWMSYRLFVPINIHLNNVIVVQSSWIREELARLFSIDSNKFAVIDSRISFNNYKLFFRSHGTFLDSSLPLPTSSHGSSKQYILIYPCLPRPFKNLYRLMSAITELWYEQFNVILLLTFDKNTNHLSKQLSKHFSGPQFRYLGYLKQSDLFSAYRLSDFLIFPSTLETLGLPLLEFSNCTGKSILASNLPYAIESLKNYSLKYFFDPYDISSIKSTILDCLEGNIPSSSVSIQYPNISVRPTSKVSWASLIDSFLLFP